MPRLNEVRVGPLAMGEILRGKLYLDGDDGPVAGFDLVRAQVTMEAKSDFEEYGYDWSNPRSLVMRVSVRTILKLEAEVRAMTNGTH